MRYLAAEVPLTVEGNQEGNPYLISDAVELAAFRDIVNGSNGGKKYLNACAKLTDDIDLSTVCGKQIGSWTPIGLGQTDAYTGIFDGNGKTISGLYCTDSSEMGAVAGLFGTVGGIDKHGTVQDLTVADSFVSASGATSTAGGIYGENRGIITDCTFSGRVQGSDSGSSYSTVTVGGVCGTNQGTIENCWNDGDVTAKTTGSAISLKAGGVCGQNSGTVRNCLNTGKVTAFGSTSNYAGGVCGDNNSGATAANCYWLDTTCDEGIGGSGTVEGTSKTSGQLASGEVAYLLNDGKTDEDTAVWRQNLGSDRYPVPDASHGLVYQITDEEGKTKYSNYENGKPDTGGETGGDTGGSSRPSGSDSAPTYRPDVEEPENGAVTVSPRNPERGDGVTITPAPEEGFEVDEITVTDRNGDAVEVTDNGDGTWTFTQPRGRVTISVTFREIPPEPLPFTGVPAGAWYEDAVRYVWENGLMTGVSASRFDPEGTTTRGQIVTLLWRLSGSPVVNYLMDFSDVSLGSYYAEAVRWATSEGIAAGYGDGRFGPNDPITREQLAVMLYRCAQHAGHDTAQGGMAIREYADYDEISGYALKAMDWAVGAGIITGTGGGTLHPQGTATRAQAAAMLERFCGLDR